MDRLKLELQSSNDVIHRERLRRPIGEHGVKSALSPDTLSPSDKLLISTRQIVNDRLQLVQDAEEEPLKPIDRIKRAFLLQNRRLRGEKDELAERFVAIDDLTTSQLTSEQIARAVLFSPMAADAEKSDNAWQLSRFNDMLAGCAISASPSVIRNLPTILEKEIVTFNRRVARRGYDISGSIDSRMRGVEAEIAAVRALKKNPDFSVRTPDTADDLKGKDISIRRDDAVIHFDIKRKSSFEERLLDLNKKNVISAAQTGQARRDGYLFTGFDDKDNGSKFIVDADALGTIRDYEYDQEGATRVVELVDYLLPEKSS